MQEISQKIGITRDVLYAEYKTIQREVRQKERDEARKSNIDTTLSPPSTDPSTVYSPSLSDQIAGYIYRYQFLDLFSTDFLYTIPDLTGISHASLLSKILLGTLDPEDTERLRIIDLHLESEHMDFTPEKVTETFRALLRKLHIVLFATEKQKLLE
jgi:hypothetical protein